MRNAITIQHATYGELDFREQSSHAIQHRLGELGISSGRKESQKRSWSFYPDVRLNFDPSVGVAMDKLDLRFLRRDGEQWELVDPPNGIHFKVRDLTPNSVKELAGKIGGAE